MGQKTSLNIYGGNFIMTEIIGVRFKTGGKQYYFDPNGQTVKDGQGVIVETGKGLE